MNQILIEPFRRTDIPRFLELAAAEQWVAEVWEFDFLLSAFPAGCFVIRYRTGAASGFVTAMLHERSGWIGNLVITESERGRGWGEKLFLCALDALRDAGAETVWLTASKLGRYLYERHGFSTIDTIERWTGQSHGCHRHLRQGDESQDDVLPIILGTDSRAWGDRRYRLLKAITGRGRLIWNRSGFMVVQPCGKALQLGPFSVLDAIGAEQLLDQALSSPTTGTTVYLDCPASNRSAAAISPTGGYRSWEQTN